MPRSLVALGGNVGDVVAAFAAAVRQLDSAPETRVVGRSRLYSTPAVGSHAGAVFLNAAVEIRSDLPPGELLARLHQIEHERGRERTVPWGPRTLDLDLIACGECVISEPHLDLPHPACWYRRFVLDPVCDLAAELIHPERGVPFGVLRQRLLARPFPVGLTGGSEALRAAILAALSAEFPQADCRCWPPATAAQWEPAVLAWFGPEESAASASAFQTLPRATRLDLSETGQPLDALRHVLQSALMKPVPLPADWPA